MEFGETFTATPAQIRHVTTCHIAWHYPVPQATSSTLRTACSLSSDTTQLLYSWVLLCVSPMYSSQTLAAFPSAYWSGRPSAATPRERVLNTLSTDMLLLVPASVFSLSLHTKQRSSSVHWLLYMCLKTRQLSNRYSLHMLAHISVVVIYMSNIEGTNFNPMTRCCVLTPTFW